MGVARKSCTHINFAGGNLTAPGGRVELGAVATEGAVIISEDASLDFSENLARGNINFNNGSRIIVNPFVSGNAGEINITARAIADTIDVEILANSISFKNSSLFTTNDGMGDAGNITATEDITISGADSNGSISGIFSPVSTGRIGNGGDIKISTNNLSLINGGMISASTFGQGNAGTIEVNATGDLTFFGQATVIFDGQEISFPSGIFSAVESEAIGEGGDIKISTHNLTLSNGGQISSTTLGQGNAGTVEIIATGDLTFDGESTNDSLSGVFSQVNPEVLGDGGNIKISTDNLILRNGAQVSSSTLGEGNAETIN